MKIESTHPDYDRIKKHWQAGELLMGGTIAMREKCNLTIPQEQMEANERYNERVERSVLFNAYRITVETMSLKPFSEPSKFTGIWGKDYEFIETNIDGAGMNMDQQLSKKIEQILRFGKYISIVNMPSLYDETGEKVSIVTQREKGLYPYISLINPESLISWSYDDEGLEMAKIAYTVQLMNSDYEVEEFERIDLWTRQEKRVFEKRESDGKKEGKEWVELTDLAVKNEIGVIPIQIGGEIEDTPPLEDLAMLNMSHFRKSSDKDNILHIANVPFPLFTGWDKDEVEAVVSVHSAYCTTNPDADIKWIEVVGAGIEQSIEDIQRLEAKMTVMGVDLLTEKKVVKTATQTNSEGSDRTSTLQAICTTVENTFEKELKIINLWMNRKPQKEGSLEVFKDFNISSRIEFELKVIEMAFANGAIDKERYLKELQSRNIFNKDFVLEDELNRITENNPL